MKLFSPKLQLKMIDTSSRMSLKLSCIAAASGDVARAQTLYDFLVDGISELPEFTPPTPSLMQQAANSVKSAVSFVKDNREDIAAAISFVQSLREPQTLTQQLPPLPQSNDATA